MKWLMSQFTGKILGQLCNGLVMLTVRTSAITSSNGGPIVDYPAQNHVNSAGSDATSSVNTIQALLAGTGGWIVLILATIALVAGVYLLTRPRIGPLPARDARSKRRSLYNAAEPDDPFSPFSPKRGLG